MTRPLAEGLFRAEDGRVRCAWCAATPSYQRYHDEEWGTPTTDERRMFEKLCLEGFQAGLSWITILNKREAFRKGFAGFDPERIAAFNEDDVQRLLADAGIVRHRGKIEATIHNARALLAMHAKGERLNALAWSHEPAKASRPKRLTLAELRKLTVSPESTALSKALKQRGFKFVGATTVYAFMQSMGIVNDHVEGCDERQADLDARRGLDVPR